MNAEETYVVARSCMQDSIDEYLKAADMAGCGERVEDELNDAFFDAGNKWKVVANE